MIAFKKDRKFNDDHTVTITMSFTFDNADFIIDTLPNTCNGCPVGYSFNHDNDGKQHIPCGVRVPRDSNRRSSECKLKSIEQWLSENAMK